MSARDELHQMLARADKRQLAIIADVIQRIAAGESDESIAASYGLKKTASGEYEKVNTPIDMSNKTSYILRSQI